MSPGPRSSGQRAVELLPDANVNLLRLATLVALAAAGAAELLVFVGRSDYALAVHVSTIVFCTAVALRDPDAVAVLKPVALLPTFRIVDLSMPVFFDRPLWQLGIVYAPLLPAALLVIASEDHLFIDVNPRRFVLFGPVAVALAVPLAVGEYQFVQPGPIVPELSVGWVVAAVVVLALSVSLVEELLFRGVLQRSLSTYYGRWVGVVLASLAFGAFHSVYGSWPAVAYATFLGLVLGVTYELAESFGLAVVTHATLNVVLFAVLPLYAEELGLAGLL